MTHGTSREPPLAAGKFAPLVGADGPDFATALQAIVTWATSTAMRERLMKDAGFPFTDDLPAFLLLNQLIYRGAARPTDLADAIQTGRSNVSKIVRRLEAADLVERAPDPRDDRAVAVGLTERGRRVAQRILQASEQAYGPAVEGWSAEELKMLEMLMVKLARSLDALPGRPLATAAGIPFPDSKVLS